MAAEACNDVNGLTARPGRHAGRQANCVFVLREIYMQVVTGMCLLNAGKTKEGHGVNKGLTYNTGE